LQGREPKKERKRNSNAKAHPLFSHHWVTPWRNRVNTTRTVQMRAGRSFSRVSRGTIRPLPLLHRNANTTQPRDLRHREQAIAKTTMRNRLLVWLNPPPTLTRALLPPPRLPLRTRTRTRTPRGVQISSNNNSLSLPIISTLRPLHPIPSPLPSKNKDLLPPALQAPIDTTITDTVGLSGHLSRSCYRTWPNLGFSSFSDC